VNRPTLIPGLLRIWRGPSELQLGADPSRAVLLQLPDPRTAQVLDLLDGTRAERAVLLRAAELGISATETRSLLDTLQAAGLVLPATSLMPGRLSGESAALALGDRTVPPTSALRRRAAARVVLTGRGRLGAPIAVALAEAGIGHVQPDLPGLVAPGELAGGPLRGTEIGQTRRAAVTEAILRAAPGTATHGVRRGSTSLVVQLDHDQPVSLVAAAHAVRRQPHLVVTIREGVAVVGPLVPPTGAPCLNCLDLHRRDRDEGWPGLPPRPDQPEPCAVATVLAASAYATAEILTYLEGGAPETLGASVEISSPSRSRRRTWPAHPRCPCGRSQKNQ
jgi:hypothetical protein